jgi:uncharacterized protein YraI
MKSLVTASLLTMLLMATAAFAAEQSASSSVPPKGIEGPDWRYSQVETRPSLELSHVR